MSTDVLKGARILVLEDEFLIAMDVEQICRDHGARDVLVAGSIDDTEADGFDIGRFDVAILDVRVGGRSSLSLADRLRAGRIPFIFASGYLQLEEVLAGFPGVPVIGKPYAESEFINAVASAVSTQSNSARSGCA